MYPSHMVQEECSKYIKEGDYENAINIFRKALKDEDHPPFCRVFTIIELALIKTKALKHNVKQDKTQNLAIQSRNKLRNLSDAQLTKAFYLIHEFIKIHPTFSINEINTYLDKQVEKEGKKNDKIKVKMEKLKKKKNILKTKEKKI